MCRGGRRGDLRVGEFVVEMLKPDVLGFAVAGSLVNLRGVGYELRIPSYYLTITTYHTLPDSGIRPISLSFTMYRSDNG